MTAKQNEPYDIVLANGRVIDPETYLDGQMHVGITGDRIAAVSETPLEGKEVIDASGLIVSPGFIDLHSHGANIPSNRLAAFDGVTTSLELEYGSLPISKFYDYCAKEGRPLNYGASVAWGAARVLAWHPDLAVSADTSCYDLWFFATSMKYGDWVHNVANKEQVGQILAQVEAGLKEGGLGIGITHGYAPGAGTKELTALCQLAAEYDVPTYTHVQNFSVLDPTSSIDSYVKLIGLAATTGAHMHICHINSTSSRDIDKAVVLVQKAIDQGLPITLGAYTWGVAESAIGAAEWNPKDVQDRLGVDWSDFKLVRTGHDFSTKEELEKAIADNPGDLVAVHYLHDETDSHDRSLLDLSVLFPGGVIETDSVPYTTPEGAFLTSKEWPLPEGSASHPRGAGTYTRFLRKWVRERGVISFMEAIRKSSLRPAQILEKSTPMMKKKGRIQVGMDADIIVFDPETVADRATFENSTQTAAGMKHVLVNGTLLIRDEQLDTEAFPGRPVRRPVIS
jgi:N-acyl-D-glutamate deacylase